MKLIYETYVKDIGNMVEQFKAENLIILFGENAPKTLKDFCYIININNINGEIKKGQTLIIGNNEFTITAVGNIAKQNLENLGHITLVFNSGIVAEMEGSIYLSPSRIPSINIGDNIIIK